MTWQVSSGHFCSYCLEIHSNMSKGKGQQVMEHSWFSLEFQLPDGKDAIQTAQKSYQLKTKSFCKCYLQYTRCRHCHLYHERNTLVLL